MKIDEAPSRVVFIGSLAVILAVSCLFHVHTLTTFPDSAWYMSNALNIYNGHGYVDADHTSKILNRGPGYPFMVAASYAIFGRSANSALLVVRLFFILNVLIIFLLAAELFDPKTAFLGSLFYLLSSQVHQWSSYVLLDNTWTFFILLGLWLLLKGIKENRFLFFLLSGLSAAAAFLIKEVAVFVLPVPLVYTFLFYRETFKVRARGLAVFYIAFFIPFAGWGLYTFFTCGHFNYLLGVFRFGLLGTVAGGETGLIAGAGKAFNGLINVYAYYIHGQFAVPGLFFLLAYGVTAWRAIRSKCKPEAFILLAFLCYLPLATLVGMVRIRTGQILIVYFFSFIMLARLFFLFLSAVNRKLLQPYVFKTPAQSTGPVPRKQQITLRAVTVSAVLFLAVFHVTGNSPPQRAMAAILVGSHNQVSFPAIDPGSVTVKGWHGEPFKRAAAWLDKNLEPGSSVMCEWHGMRSLYFFTDGKFKMVPIPLRLSRHRFIGGHHEQRYDSYPDYEQSKGEQPLFLWSTYNKASSNPKYYLLALCESDLVERMEREKTGYVIITAHRNFLDIYFSGHRCYEKIKEFDGGKIRVYKVRCIGKKTSHTMRLGSNIKKYLEMVKKEQPRRYEHIRDHFLGEKLAFSHNDIDTILKGNYIPVELFKVYPGTF